MNRGLLIAFEGIDGSGKSSQAKLLADKLIANGEKVYTTFEPTGNYIGAILRDILRGNRKADERTIAGLFLADRLDHLLNEDYGLLKKIIEGYIVITDRYYFSSYAYHGTHMDINWVIQANDICAQILRPDINLFIDVTPEIAIERISANRKNTERYETLENLENVRAKYFEAFDLLRNKENISIIEGNRSLKEIQDQVWNLIEQIR